MTSSGRSQPDCQSIGTLMTIVAGRKRLYSAHDIWAGRLRTGRIMRFRMATLDDLAAIVKLLADDPLGAEREEFRDPLPPEYVAAFHAIERQTGNCVIVVVDNKNIVHGCLQLTYTPGIARKGMCRATIEGVRVSRAHRGSGLGAKLVAFAIEEARKANCGLVQLTTDRTRYDAHRFYEKLGFEPSHIGMKFKL